MSRTGLHLFVALSAALLYGSLVLLLPLPARADAPATRGPETAGFGGTPPAEPWSNLAPLPPVTQLSPARDAAAAGTFRSAGATSGAAAAQTGMVQLAWLDRSLNPGNWVLDAGLGIATGEQHTQLELVQQGLLLFTGSGTDPCLRIVFCTDVGLFFNADGSAATLDQVWTALQPVAAGLLVLLFIWRIGEMALAGPLALHAETRSTLLAFVGALVLITQLRWPAELILNFWAALNTLLLNLAPLPIKPQFGLIDLLALLPGLSLGAAYLLKAVALLALALVVLALWRLLKLWILLAVAPLIGVCLMSRGTAGYARAWAGKLLDTLLQQSVWALSFSLGSVLVHRFRQGLPAGPSSFFAEAFGLLVVLLLTICSTTVLHDIFADHTSGHSIIGALFRLQVVRAASNQLQSATSSGRSRFTPAPGGPAPVPPTSVRGIAAELGQTARHDPLALPRRALGHLVREATGWGVPTPQQRWQHDWAVADARFRGRDPEPPRGTAAHADWQRRYATFRSAYEAAAPYPVPAAGGSAAGDTARRLIQMLPRRAAQGASTPPVAAPAPAPAATSQQSAGNPTVKLPDIEEQP